MLVDNENDSREKNVEDSQAQEMKTFREFFRQQKNNISDSKSLVMSKDVNMDLTYLLAASNNLLVINATKYEIKKRLNIPDKIRPDDTQKITCVNQSGQLFLVLHNTNTLFMFPFTDKFLANTLNTSLEQKLVFLKENEQIVKISSINNELNIPILILISSLSKTYFIKFSFHTNLMNFDLTYEELNEKPGFLRKFISNFLPSTETSKVFIMNPFSYTKFLKNNKKNNILFLMNEEYLKKIELNVTGKGVEPEVKLYLNLQLNFQINTNNLIIEKLKPYIKSSEINSRNISIESADVFHDKINKQNSIYFVVKYESQYENSNLNATTFYYLLKMQINHVTNEINLNVLIDFKASYQENLSPTNIVNLVVNKYTEEVMIIFSQPKSSHILYYSANKEEVLIHKMGFEIRGINVINPPEEFSIDVLSLTDGVFNLSFKGQLNILDKTKLFLEQVVKKDEPVDKFADKNLNQNENGYNNLNTFNPFSTFPSPSNPNRFGKNLDFLFNTAIKNFYENNFSAPKTPTSEEAEIILNMHRELKKYDSDEIANCIITSLLKLINDDSTNVDIINKDSVKAELVIIEYLRQKDTRLNNVYDFLLKYRIFELFDPKKIIFLSFLQCKEKLTVAIRLREFENSLLDKNVNLSSISGKINKINYYTVADSLFKMFYVQMKEMVKLSNDSFNKYVVYSKVSSMDQFMEKLFNVYQQFIDAFQTSKEDKASCSFILINLISSILSSIINLHDIYFENNTSVFDMSQSVLKDNFNNLWLLREDFLEYFRSIFYRFLEFYSVLNHSYSNETAADLMKYVDNILYLYDMYFKVNESSDNKKVHFEMRKDIISKIIPINAESSLAIAEKYRDFYSITFICYNNQWVERLKDTMEKYKDNTNVLMYFLKLYLLFETENNRSLNRKFNEFKYFEHFYKYKEEVKIVVQKFPKLATLYDIFLKSRDSNDCCESRVIIEDLTRKIVDNKNISLFLKFAKIVNSLNKYNLEDMLVKQGEQQINFTEKELAQFKVENDVNCKEINFTLLVNYLITSFLMKSDNKNVFLAFEKMIRELIVFDSKTMDSYTKYKIAVNLVLLANEINNKFKQENYDINMFENLFKEILICAMKEDYILVSSLFEEKFKADSIDALSDDQRKEILSTSIVANMLSFFAAGKELIPPIFVEGIAFDATKSKLKTTEYYYFIKSLLN